MVRMRLVFLIVVLLVLGAISTAFAVRVECGVAQYSNGQHITFAKSFTSAPVIVTNAQGASKAVSSCAMNNSATGFDITLIDDNKQAVSNAWVQWLAFIPDPSVQVQGGVVYANNGQQISFPAMSNSPVVITSAQSGGAINSAPTNVTTTGFKIALKDQDNNSVGSAWLQWLAVVPGTQNGFKGGRGTRDNYASVGFSPAFSGGPTILNTAEKSGEPCAASAVGNSPSGFTLYLTRHDGSAGSGFRTYTLGYTPTPTLYAIVSGGENTGNPYYGWYWGATSGMYDVLKNRYGCSDANIYFYFCDTHSNNSRVDGVSTKANIQAAFTALKSRMNGNDKLFCYFVGHGLYTGGKSTYDTVGADIYDSDMNSWRQGLPAEQTYVFTQCYSGHFCTALKAQGTVVFTSCQYNETNAKAFAEPIRDALNMVSGADANGNGKVSIGEAYNYALNNVKQQYGTAALTEHCQCEDNGDGTSTYGVIPTGSHGSVAMNRFLN